MINKLFFTIAFMFVIVSSKAQKITNIGFEQVGKQIYIYYDLQGKQNYNVEVYCKSDDGTNWGYPLHRVSGAVGNNQHPGTRKKIIWDVLEEREELTGDIQFKIECLEEYYSNSGKYTDARDGQTYTWVEIGNQVWMAENLNYNTGTGNSWCYDNKSLNCDTYGRLYDWKTACNGCPDGWHLPSDNEWKALEMQLGMNQSEVDDRFMRGTNEGKKMKSTTGWHRNGNGTNSSGFNALPGGRRNSNGSFEYLSDLILLWSATEYSGSDSWVRYMRYEYDQVSRSNGHQAFGFSVRCVRD